MRQHLFQLIKRTLIMFCDAAREGVVSRGIHRKGGAIGDAHAVYLPEHADVTVAIDIVTNVGAFIEVEVLTADPAGAAAVLDRIEHDLGTTDLQLIELPYRDLVLRASSVVAVSDE